METVLAQHTLPEDKQIKLFTHLRLAYAFPSFDQRLLCIQARLQALSILGNFSSKKMLIYLFLIYSVYSAAIQEANNVLYDGLIEELVEVLHVRDPTLTVSFIIRSIHILSVFLSKGYQSFSLKNINIHYSS